MEVRQLVLLLGSWRNLKCYGASLCLFTDDAHQVVVVVHGDSVLVCLSHVRGDFRRGSNHHPNKFNLFPSDQTHQYQISLSSNSYRTMKANYELCLSGRNCIFVPYRKFHTLECCPLSLYISWTDTDKYRDDAAGHVGPGCQFDAAFFILFHNRFLFSLLTKKTTGLFSGPEHVSNYHQWMQDPTLLDATASEPLTMDEEIMMQGTWRDDETKCTFIILARDLVLPASSSADDAATVADDDVRDTVGGWRKNDTDASFSIPPPPTCQTMDATTRNAQKNNPYPLFIEQTLHAMIGDINLFLSEEDDDDNNEEEEEGLDGSKSSSNPVEAARLPLEPNSARSLSSSSSFFTNKFSQAELDIMIAPPCHRNKNLGTEAALMMMHYGASQLHIRRFFVKIKDTNLSSLRLFRDKLGFGQVTYVECFGEYELDCKCETWEEMVAWVERRWREMEHSCRSRRTGIGFGIGCDKDEQDTNIGGGDDNEVHCRMYNVHNCPLIY